MKEILLSQNKVAIVDDDMFEYLNQWKWSLGCDGYAFRLDYMVSPRKHINMSRLIMRAQDGFQVDHINRDKLDNRRCNLRVCTQTQNRWNTGKRSHNTSKFKGVSFNKYHLRWEANICCNGRRIWLGRFATPEEASVAYQTKAKELFGEFYSGVI